MYFSKKAVFTLGRREELLKFIWYVLKAELIPQILKRIKNDL